MIVHVTVDVVDVTVDVDVDDRHCLRSAAAFDAGDASTMRR